MKNPNRKFASNNAPKERVRGAAHESTPVYPFSAIVGQEEMKLALILNVIHPAIGGALIMGHRGTGKSTAVRGLAELLPDISVVKNCPYRCDPTNLKAACEACRAERASSQKIAREHLPVAVVELPLGSTEDRVCGSIDIQRALSDGVKAFEPGLLARANRGFLYIDEVNLLEDHLVDVLLDVAATGANKVERENVSVTHPASFVLIGSGNPEEGELRPQLLDRFGLSVEVETEVALDQRVEIVERREAFDRNPIAFTKTFAEEQERLRKRITAAQKQVASIKLDNALLRKIAELCSELRIDGHRGELTIARAARALAAFEGKRKVSIAEVKRVAAMAVLHRLRRDPLEERGSAERVQQAIERLFPEKRSLSSQRDGEDGGGNEGLNEPESSNSELSYERQRFARASSPRGVGDAEALKPTELVRDHEASIPQIPKTQRKSGTRLSSQTNQRIRNRSVTNHIRGRYVRGTPTRAEGARLSVEATLRVAALNLNKNDGRARHISTSDLRFKELSQKSGRLFIFAIDTSGSMALHRIKQAKRSVLGLLKQSYVHRDQVAIIGFRGDSANTYLPPSRSILRARRVLDSLLVGGSTPLSAGLLSAMKLAKNAAGKFGEVCVLLFTDGNANVPLSGNESNRLARQVAIEKELTALGLAFAKLKVRVVVVDSQDSFVRSGDVRALAQRLGGQYSTLKEEQAV